MRLGRGGMSLGRRGRRRGGTGLPVSGLRNDPGYMLKCFLSHHVAGAGPSYTMTDANVESDDCCGGSLSATKWTLEQRIELAWSWSSGKLGLAELCTICSIWRGLSKGNYGAVSMSRRELSWVSFSVVADWRLETGDWSSRRRGRGEGD